MIDDVGVKFSVTRMTWNKRWREGHAKGFEEGRVAGAKQEDIIQRK